MCRRRCREEKKKKKRRSAKPNIESACWCCATVTMETAAFERGGKKRREVDAKKKYRLTHAHTKGGQTCGTDTFWTDMDPFDQAKCRSRRQLFSFLIFFSPSVLVFFFIEYCMRNPIPTSGHTLANMSPSLSENEQEREKEEGGEVKKTCSHASKFTSCLSETTRKIKGSGGKKRRPPLQFFLCEKEVEIWNAICGPAPSGHSSK